MSHGDFALALTRCSCSALRELAVFVRECGKCKSLYASVIERCVALPVGTWSAAREQSFRFDGGHVHNVTTSHFERKETKTKFVSNKTAIYRRNRSSVCLLFVKLALLCVFLCLSDLSHTQEQTGSMPWMQAVAPSPSYNRDGSETVRTFDKEPIAIDLQRFVSVLWFRHAQLRDLVEVWALTGECSPPVRECSPPDRNRPIFFVQTLVDFALSLPGHSLWVCLRPGPWIFSQKRQIRTRSEN